VSLALFVCIYVVVLCIMPCFFHLINMWTTEKFDVYNVILLTDVLIVMLLLLLASFFYYSLLCSAFAYGYNDAVMICNICYIKD